MWPSPEAVPVQATIFPVLPGYSFIKMANMAPMAAASAAPLRILVRMKMEINSMLEDLGQYFLDLAHDCWRNGLA